MLLSYITQYFHGSSQILYSWRCIINSCLIPLSYVFLLCCEFSVYFTIHTSQSKYMFNHLSVLLADRCSDKDQFKPLGWVTETSFIDFRSSVVLQSHCVCGGQQHLPEGRQRCGRVSLLHPHRQHSGKKCPDTCGSLQQTRLLLNLTFSIHGAFNMWHTVPWCEN